MSERDTMDTEPTNEDDGIHDFQYNDKQRNHSPS